MAALMATLGYARGGAASSASRQRRLARRTVSKAADRRRDASSWSTTVWTVFGRLRGAASNGKLESAWRADVGRDDVRLLDGLPRSRYLEPFDDDRSDLADEGLAEPRLASVEALDALDAQLAFSIESRRSQPPLWLLAPREATRAAVSSAIPAAGAPGTGWVTVSCMQFHSSAVLS